MLVEQHFSDLNRHPKPVDPEWAATVAKYLEEVGATDLDDPNTPRRKVQRTDAQLRALAGIERKKAEEKAQAEYKKAQARLNDGTAVLRQKKDRTPLLVAKPKVAKAAKKVAKKATKPARNIAKPAKKLARITAVKKGPTSQQLDKIRRDAVIADLSAGKMVRMVSECKKNNEQKDYQKQRADLIYIKRNMDITLIRLSRIQTGESFFMIDSLERYKQVKVSGNLIGPDREPLIKALSSGKLFEVSNVIKGKKAGSASVAQLADRHGMNLYAVISGRDLVGWVMPKDVEVALTAEQKCAAKDAQ